MKKILFSLILLAFGFPALAQQYNQYCNSVFAFCVDIPSNFSRLGVSATGDGQFFKAKDGSTLSVYATENFQNESLKQHFDRVVSALTNDSTLGSTTQLPVIEKAETADNSYTIIYQNNGATNLIYRRLDKNVWKSIELQFPTSKTEEYMARVKRIIASMR